MSSTIPLGNLLEITSGYAFSSDNFSESRGMPLVRIRDVMRGRTDLKFDGDYDPRYVIGKDDLLISMDGEFRVSEWQGGPALLNQRVCRVEPKGDLLDPRFLRHFLPSKLKEIEDRTPFVTVKHLSAKSIKAIEFPAIALSEQRRIATILDKADAIRRKREQAFNLTDDFLKSVFLEMFGDLSKNDRGWPTALLRKHIQHSNNGLSRRRKVLENVGQIVLRIQDIKANSIDFGQCNRIALDDKEKSRFELAAGDILFVRVNGNREYVGRCTVFRGYSEPVYHNDHIIRLKMDDAVDPEFLSFLFNLDMGRQLLSSAIKTSAGQYTISQDGINELRLPCPPSELQRRFNKLVGITERQRTTLASAHQESVDLFASLSQRAFRSEL